MMSGDDCFGNTDMPYPNLVIPYKDTAEARRLMNFYGGEGGKTTSFFQYLYQSYMLRLQFPDFADALKSLALSELQHHSLLSQTITALGGYPIIGGKTGFWNGSYVNYNVSLADLILHDIKLEEDMIEYCEMLCLTIENATIKLLLERIIIDDEQHLIQLKRLLQSVETNFSPT